MVASLARPALGDHNAGTGDPRPSHRRQEVHRPDGPPRRITPKTLTQRLRELQDTGIVTADRKPGRREVWYRLTPAGADLRPVIDALGWRGLRHAWRFPQDGEPLHAEHLLRSAIQAIDHAAGDHRPARWHFRLDGADYLAESDGQHWSLTDQAPAAPADVTITATTKALQSTDSAIRRGAGPKVALH